MSVRDVDYPSVPLLWLSNLGKCSRGLLRGDDLVRKGAESRSVGSRAGNYSRFKRSMCCMYGRICVYIPGSGPLKTDLEMLIDLCGIVDGSD